MLDPHAFRRQVIRPALIKLGLHSSAAEALLLGTALSESGLVHLVQTGGGPARGLYQIEPATHRDIWLSYLAYRPSLAERVLRLAAGARPGAGQLVWNLGYATAIARLVYFRVPDPLPAADDLESLARYYKAHFNTVKGKAKVEDFLRKAGSILENT